MAAAGPRHRLLRPLIKGNPAAQGLRVAGAGVPDDLLNLDISEVYPELKGLQVRGRLVSNKVLPYHSAPTSTGKSASPARRCWHAGDCGGLSSCRCRALAACSCPTAASCAWPTRHNGHPTVDRRWLADKGSCRRASVDGGIKNWAQASGPLEDAQRQPTTSSSATRPATVARSGARPAATEGAAWLWTRAAFRWGAGVSGDEPPAQHPVAAAPVLAQDAAARSRAACGATSTGLRRRGWRWQAMRRRRLDAVAAGSGAAIAFQLNRSFVIVFRKFMVCRHGLRVPCGWCHCFRHHSICGNIVPLTNRQYFNKRQRGPAGVRRRASRSSMGGSALGCQPRPRTLFQQSWRPTVWGDRP
jgi:hypothetical protein